MADKMDVPAWFERALDPSTPTTENEETMRTQSDYVEDLGGEVIYPTIRMNKAGRLFKPKNPLKSALDNGDYILIEGPPGEETAAKATEMSKRMSEAVARSRTPVDQTDRLLKEAEERMTSDTVSFADGGLLDEGGTVDPVSGNEVPAGSTQEEVRDDIPAQLSEGEFVFPADVVRYIGLENLMKLRQKAKQGLQKMDAMGQMGNAEEATMEDDGEYEGEVSEMIESIPMASGGMVNNPFARGLSRIKAQAGTFVPQQGVAPVVPPVSAPKMPPTPVTAGQLAQSQMRPKRSPVKYEYRQYQGPSGEMITIAFINGQPTQQIPQGYTEYDPTKQAQAKPDVAAPAVATVDDSSPEVEERREKEKQQYTNYVDTMDKLSKISTDFAKEWEKSPHKSGSKAKAGSAALATMGISAAFQEKGTYANADKVVEQFAAKYGLDPNDYKNTGLNRLLSDYDVEKFADDAIVTKAVADSLGIVPDDIKDKIKRTNFERDGEGGISVDSLVDKNTGELTQTGKDLFNIDEGYDESIETEDPDTTVDMQSEAATSLGGEDAPGISVEVSSAKEEENQMAKGGMPKRKKKGLGRLKV